MSFRSRLAAVLFPERCPYCSAVIRYGEKGCARCLSALQRIPPFHCVECVRPLSECRCHRKSRYFERCVSPFFYKSGAKQAVLWFKEHNSRQRAQKLAAEMAAVVKREFGDATFDGLVCVPMTHSDERERGFNQSRVLAKELSRLTGIPLYDCLEKLFPTAPQKSLPATFRSGNVLGVFEVKENHTVDGLRLLLVDDLMTTGATLNECAKILRIRGAEAVLAVTLAVTLPPDRK